MKVFRIVFNKFKIYNELNQKYDVSLMAARNSFFLIVALISWLFLFLQIYNFFSNVIENFLLTKVINVFTNNYQNIIYSIIPILKFNGFSGVLILSLLWSSSNVINCMNRTADKIYQEIKARNLIISRVNSFFMFSMLILIIVFELLFVAYINKVMFQYLGSSLYIIIRLLQKIIEILLLYFLILLVYIYVVPIRMSVKKAYKGSLLATLGFYLISSILLLIIKFFFNEHFSYGLASSFSLFFVWVYLINEVLIWGLIYNYQVNKLD